MKKSLLVLLIAILLCACIETPGKNLESRIEVADAEATTSMPILEDVIDMQQSTSQAQSWATTLVPNTSATPAEKSTSAPSTPVVSSVANEFKLDKTVQCPTATSTLLIPVTVRESYQRAGDTLSTTFANHTLDFSALSFAITSLDSTDSGTTVSISVDFPPAWSNSEIHSLLLYLGFSLSLDDRIVSDFRLLMQTPSPTLSQIESRVGHAEYRFISESLTVEKLYGCQTLSIAPYVDYRETMFGCKANGLHDVDLLSGETCTFSGSEYRYSGVELRRTIEALVINIPLPKVFTDQPSMAKAQTPLLLPVTLWDEDWEKNAEVGKYRGDPSFYYGTLHNEIYDFSGLCFDLEKAMIWENGFRIACRLILPDSWSDEEVSAFLTAKHGGNNLKIQLRVDGVDENFHGFLMVPAGYYYASYTDRKPKAPHEIFCICEENTSHFPQLLNAKSIQISIYSVHADYVNDGVNHYDLTGGASVYIDSVEMWRSDQYNLLKEIEVPLSTFIGIEEVEN